MTSKLKEIDFKSFIIGFLLAAVILLSLGAGSGTQDVRIVDINTSDLLKVEVEDWNNYKSLPVKITDIKDNVEIGVVINGSDYGSWKEPIPVKIKE